MPVSSIHGICQAKYWSGLPFPSLGDLLDPGVEPTSLALAGSFFTTESPGKTLISISSVQLLKVAILCNPLDCSMPGLPVHNQLPEFTQTMSIKLVMPSNHLILYHPLLLSPSVFPSIRIFSNESALRMRWPKCWSFSVNISPSNEHSGLTSFRMDWLDLRAVQDSQKSSPTPQFKSINSLVFSFLYSSTLTSIHDYWKNHSLGLISLQLCKNSSE